MPEDPRNDDPVLALLPEDPRDDVPVDASVPVKILPATGVGEATPSDSLTSTHSLINWAIIVTLILLGLGLVFGTEPSYLGSYVSDGSEGFSVASQALMIA